MKRHGAALPLVAHLDLQSEDVRQLALERRQICVDWLRVAAALARCRAGPGRFFSRRLLLRLAHRKSLGDDFARQRFRDRPRRRRPGRDPC